MAADRLQDDPQDSRWVTYDQLAEARGTSRASAVRQARRKKWRRQQDNHGNVTVLVPVTDLQPSEDNKQDYPEDDPQYSPGLISALREAFQMALVAKDGQIEALQGQVTVLRAEMAAARKAADQAEINVDRLEAELEATKIGQAEAEADVAELRRADAERRGQGRLQRLRAAWRGE